MHDQFTRVLSVFFAVSTLFLQCAPARPPLTSVPPVTADGGTTQTQLPLATEGPSAGRLPQDVSPTRYTLDLQVRPESETYRGTVTIQARLQRPRSTIYLHGQDLRVGSVRVQQGNESPIAAQWAQQSPEGVASITLERPAHAGDITLRLEFERPYHTGQMGLYRARSGGDSYAITKFEPLGARAAFPCFDEPSFKSIFEVSLTVPNELVAVSNTRETSRDNAPDEQVTVHFAPTQPLPTYLVAWAVGPFEVIDNPPITVSPVRMRRIPLRGLAPRGQGLQIRAALIEARTAITALEDYFGIEYPFDKLDLLAAPEFPTGAMENAGLVMFRDGIVLIDPATATERQRREMSVVVAHELAHQWFGNLVTMSWWNDLWLNEAFAEWMGYRIVQQLHPEFHSELNFMQSMYEAMGTDAHTNARSIRQPIESIHDIRNAFDHITYMKGAAVLGMFERYVTPQAFRQGIHNYLSARPFGNAAADDLLSAIATAGRQDSSFSEAFHTFLDQPGLATVQARIVCSNGPPIIELEQHRYTPLGATGNSEGTWHIPVCARYGVGNQVRTGCSLLTDSSGQIEVPGTECPTWVMPNLDGLGYYRWTLPADALTTLRTQAWAALSPAERLSVAANLQAGFESNQVTVATMFDFIPTLAVDASYEVAVSPIRFLTFANDYLITANQRPRLQAIARQAYRPVFQRLGWSSLPQETGDQTQLRRDVLTLLGMVVRDQAVRTEAVRRGVRFLGLGNPPTRDLQAIPKTLAEAVIAITIQERGSTAIPAAMELMSSRDGDIRLSVVRALGAVRTPAVAQEVRNFMSAVSSSGANAMILLNEQFRHPEVQQGAWEWYQEHFEQIVRRIPTQWQGYLPTVPSRLCSTAYADQLQAFFATRVERLEGAPRNAANTVEQVRLCAEQVRTHAPATQAFLGRR